MYYQQHQPPQPPQEPPPPVTVSRAPPPVVPSRREKKIIEIIDPRTGVNVINDLENRSIFHESSSAELKSLTNKV